MKLTSKQLKQIIQEEIGKVMSESDLLPIHDAINAIFQKSQRQEITKEQAYNEIMALGEKFTDPESQEWIKQASEEIKPEPELELMEKQHE